MTESRLNFHKSIIHPLLSIAVPLIFLISCNNFIRLLVIDRIIPSNPPGTNIILFLTGLCEASVTNVLTKQRSTSLLPRIREVFPIFLIATTIFMLSSGYLLSGDYNPLHLDVLLARRLLFGSPVVHGIHSLLWSLDCWLNNSSQLIEFKSIKALFYIH